MKKWTSLYIQYDKIALSYAVSFSHIQPSLGHSVRKKNELLNFLKDREAKGMGGVAMKDIEEAVPKAAKVVQV